MALKKEYLVLILVIAALSLYLIVQKSSNIRYELPKPEPFVKSDITKLTIVKRGTTITLGKEDDRWYLHPQGFPADSGIVENLLDEINGMRLTALASESKNYTLYELDEDNRIIVTIYRGEEQVRSITIGKLTSSSRHTFVRWNSDHRVYHAADNLRTTFDKTAPDLRDKTVMNIDEDISALTVIKGRKKLTFIKAERARAGDHEDQQAQKNGPEVPSQWNTADGRPANDTALNSIIQFLSRLTCDAFIEGKRNEEYRSPLYTVQLKGATVYTISLFPKEESTYPAVSSESSYPFLIAEWKANKIMKEFDELVAPKQ